MKTRVVILLACWTPILFLWANPALPTIPTNVFNVVDYGAVGDGVTTNTTAIQNAINTAAASAAKGGIVEIPAAGGAYLCGPITLKSSINLQIDSGATLMMLPYASWPGTTTFISGSSLHDVEISGAGTIDGQGADWWTAYESSGVSRPNFIQFSSTKRILIQDVTLQNPPTFHLMLKNNNGDVTIQGITINTSGNSPNTDGMDVASTNLLVQNCFISDGDDNIEIGGSQKAADIVVTNCTFGFGHGVSFGSITSGDVSNVTVVNCTFNGTQYGIRLKSDDRSSGGGAGGLVQNLSFFNIGMTNISRAPIVIYSYYEEFGTPTSITPAVAAAQTIPSPVPDSTVVWRNITISNLTATVADSGIAGIIWGRTELPVTNVILSHVNITASQTFDVYNAYNVQFADSQIALPNGNETFTIYNAGLVLTNDMDGIPGVTLDGLTSTNSLALDNASLSTDATDIFGANPITLDDATLAVNGDLALTANSILNFALGTNATEITATGNLALNGAINVANADGVNNYTLFIYGGGLSGNFASASFPTNYVFDTNTVGRVNLTVNPSSQPLPPVNLTFLPDTGNRLQISWPSNYIGWHLEIQTNAPGVGLGTNWVAVSGSNGTNEFFLPMDSANGSVFLRLVYP